MKHTLHHLIFIISIILITFSVSYITRYYYDVYVSNKEKTYLNNIINENVINNDIYVEDKDSSSQDSSAQNNVTDENPADFKTERMQKIVDLQSQNADIIGWIEIENTNINYPVLQGSDNSFYMKHNYKKQWSSNGSIFLDKAFSWNPPSSNLLIYGHNNKNNTMFQSLLNYKSRKFYEQHPTIRFTTINDDFYYDIISVFESKVYLKSDKNVFRYYYFVNANNKAEFDDFVQNAKNASLYDIDKSADYGEQLMTLSTCSYHTKDGRFVVVAKKSSAAK